MAESAKGEPILVKRYARSRLYAPAVARYLTVEQLKHWADDGRALRGSGHGDGRGRDARPARLSVTLRLPGRNRRLFPQRLPFCASMKRRSTAFMRV